MGGIKCKSTLNAKALHKRVTKSSFENLGHAGANIRLVARKLIKTSNLPAAPGEPVHTRRGQIKKAIIYNVDKVAESVVVGPEYSVVGPAAVPHEFGGLFRGFTYAARPFMGPAMQKLKPRLDKFWANTVK